jgi:hypothetical protein
MIDYVFANVSVDGGKTADSRSFGDSEDTLTINDR